MKVVSLFFFSILSVSTTTAQQAGRILNKETKVPIPFVNMHVLGTTNGFTTDLNGKFSFSVNPDDSVAISAIGYELQTLEASKLNGNILLQPVQYNIPEVKVTNDEKLTHIGRVKKQIFSYAHSTSSGNTLMLGRFFEFKEEYLETSQIKSIELLTDSEVDSAQFNIRIYDVDSNGFPNKPIHNSPIFVFPKKGYHKTEINLEKLYLQFPESGLFIAIEWLQLEQNLHEYTYVDSRTKKRIKSTTIEPTFYVESNQDKGFGWEYSGHWRVKKDFFSRLIQMKVTLKN